MTDTRTNAEREKQLASLVSVSVVLILIALKVVVGLLTGSLGILAQVADSILDLVAAVLAFLAVRVADRPADMNHLYGHGKAENLAALGETLLLLVTCGWIFYEAIQRLFFHPVVIESSAWGIAVMLLTILASLWLSTYLMGVARRHNSQSLEGNALNFRTDVLSSSVVLLGLVLVWLSQRLGPEWAWLQDADAVAAVVVAAMVLRVSLGLGWRALNELLDAAPPGLVDQISEAALLLPGVERVGPVRVRQAGADTFVDITIHVERSASLEQAHLVATSVEHQIGDLIQRGDVVVHVDPVRQVGESLPQAVTAIAYRLGMRAHNVHAHEVRGESFVDVHVEVAPDLTLAEAHEQVSDFEAAVRKELSYVSDIHTHIEPRAQPTVLSEMDKGEVERLEAQICAVAESVPGLHTCHHLHIRPIPDGYDVVLDCLADPDLLVGEAHRLADQAEKRLYAEIPRLAQVSVHVEPSLQSKDL